MLILFSLTDSSNALFGIGNLTIRDCGKDPYITLEGSDDDSEKDDDIIKPDDNLIVVGHVEGDVSTLEIYGKLEASILKLFRILKY